MAVVERSRVTAEELGRTFRKLSAEPHPHAPSYSTNYLTLPPSRVRSLNSSIFGPRPTMPAGNRKERRAAAKSSSAGRSKGTSTAFQPSTEIDQDGVEMILKHPDRSGPKGKTLFDRAEERQRELDKERGVQRPTSAQHTYLAEDPIGPLGNALLYSISLATVHLTFDVIVYSQYREEVVWPEVFKRAGSAMPIFFVLIYLLHVDTAKRLPVLRNLFFFTVSVIAGCYLVYSANKHGYFFVMKTAPPIGALWIWSVVEMSLWYAVPSCAVVIGYLWWNGFDAF